MLSFYELYFLFKHLLSLSVTLCYSACNGMVWCGVVVLYGVTVWLVCLAICVASVVHYCHVKMSECDQLTEVTCQGHFEASKHTL